MYQGFKAISFFVKMLGKINFICAILKREGGINMQRNENGKHECPFIMIPKSVLKSPLSPAAKVVYFAMIERFGLSSKNGWVTIEGETYIILSCKEIQEILFCSKSTAVKTLAELEYEGYITRKHQGRGFPDLIFLTNKIPHKKLILSVKNKDLKGSENHTQRGIKNIPQEDLNLVPNKNNNNKNKIIKNKNNYSFIPFSHISAEERKEYKEFVKENISYDALIGDRRKEIIDEIVNAMVDALSMNCETVPIGKISVTKEELNRRILNMNQFHIEYICDSLQKNTSNIKNMSAYLLSCIYRATSVINVHYDSMVRYDLKN